MKTISFCGFDIDEEGELWLAESNKTINIWFDPLNRERGPKQRGKAKRLRGRRSPIRDRVKHGETGTLLETKVNCSLSAIKNKCYDLMPMLCFLRLTLERT